MKDLGWTTNDFIARNVCEGVYNFTKATENEVFIIEDFTRRLQSRLTTNVEVCFVERTPGHCLCFYPTICENGSKRFQQQIAQTIASEIQEESRCGLTVRYFEKRVPKKNLYLLFNSAQALVVALNIQKQYLAEEDSVFLSSLEFAYTERRNPQYLIELLCRMAHHFRGADRWRTGVLCLEQADALIGSISENLDALSITPEEIARLTSQVGDFYNEFDMAERAIALSEKTLNTIELKLGLQEGEMGNYVDTSYWKDCHDSFWLTNGNLVRRFENFAGLIPSS